MTEVERAIERKRTEQPAAGEYGASRVFVNEDGGNVRISFGRSNSDSSSTYYLAVHLTPDAIRSLKEQLGGLE